MHAFNSGILALVVISIFAVNISVSSLYIEIDGACKGNPGPSGIGIVIKNSSGELIAEIARPIGITTNNVAEYSALLAGMQEAIDRGATDLTVQTDSELLARQVQGRYKVSAPHLRPLYQQVLALKQRFARFEINHSLRGFNSSADALANEGVKANTKSVNA